MEICDEIIISNKSESKSSVLCIVQLSSQTLHFSFDLHNVKHVYYCYYDKGPILIGMACSYGGVSEQSDKQPIWSV